MALVPDWFKKLGGWVFSIQSPRVAPHTTHGRCKVCNKVFVRSYRLKRHMVVHTGQKPFPCRYCGRRFTQKSNVNLHLRNNCCCKAPNRLEKKRKAQKQRKKTNESRDEDVEIVMATVVECSGDLTSTLPSSLIVNSLIDL